MSFKKATLPYKNPYIASNLKHLRNAHNLSQYSIADKLKIDRSTYCYYELGKTEPSVSMITKIMEIYNKEYKLNLTFNDMLSKNLVKDGITLEFASTIKLVELLNNKRQEYNDSDEFYCWLKEWSYNFAIYVVGDKTPKQYNDLVKM